MLLQLSHFPPFIPFPSTFPPQPAFHPVVHVHGSYIQILFFFSRKREKRGGEGEREGEKLQSVVAPHISHALNWGPGQQPRHVPWLGIKPVTLWFTGLHSIHWATPARAPILFLTSPCLFCTYLLCFLFPVPFPHPFPQKLPILSFSRPKSLSNQLLSTFLPAKLSHYFLSSLFWFVVNLLAVYLPIIVHPPSYNYNNISKTKQLFSFLTIFSTATGWSSAPQRPWKPHHDLILTPSPI